MLHVKGNLLKGSLRLYVFINLMDEQNVNVNKTASPKHIYHKSILNLQTLYAMYAIKKLMIMKATSYNKCEFKTSWSELLYEFSSQMIFVK